MSHFTIVIEYLTGYAVATDPVNREKPEWPPHPARVFMALAAAHFETDASPEDKQAERTALEWLASLPSPELSLPDAFPRDVLKTYVPPNDYTIPNRPGELSTKAVKDAVCIMPAYRTNKQERCFPRVYVGDAPIRLVWATDSDNIQLHLHALEAVCRKVTRIGHSSSLVWVRIERSDESHAITHKPDEHAIGNHLRVAGEGMVSRLEQAFNANNIAAYAELEQRIDEAKGKVKKQLQLEMDQRFPHGKPISQRPVISLSSGYVPVSSLTPDMLHSSFDPQLIVLRESDDSPGSFGLESTLLVTNALRNLLFKESGVQPVPDWLSGHDGTSGAKLATGQGHLALVPLPFIGRQYADGHLMGIAIVLPRAVPMRERAKVLSPVLFDAKTNQPKKLKLTLGSAGELWLERDASFSLKHNLRPTTWTHLDTIWASVTPIVLDRMPKSDRVKAPLDWRKEVSGIIAKSCTNIGLPEPIGVRVEKTPFFQGSLRAMPGQGGFPVLRSGTFQVHVEIEFSAAVQGPILLGAGRFRGYGICRPFVSGEAS